MFDRRVVLAGFAIAPLTVRAALAQTDYPSRPIRFIVPAGAGGLADVVARVVAKRLQENVGQPVVVENKPGGNGAVAVAALMSAPPDGYSFIVHDGALLTINPHIYASLSYRLNDLTPVAEVARAPLFLAVHQHVPAATMQEFIAYVRAHPGKLNYASSGVGSAHHLSMEALMSALNLNMVHVPFKGTSESVPALLGGHVDVAYAAYPNLSGAVTTGSIRIIATNGAQRSPMAPDVPVVADFVPGYDFAPRIGLYARTGAPSRALAAIAAAVVSIAGEPEIGRQFAAAGIEATGGDGAAFKAALERESQHVAATVKTAGMKAQ